MTEANDESNTFAKPEIINSFIVLCQHVILTAQPAYLEFQDTHVLKSLLVLKFAFMQSQINDLQFLVQKRYFIIATY